MQIVRLHNIILHEKKNIGNKKVGNTLLKSDITLTLTMALWNSNQAVNGSEGYQDKALEALSPMDAIENNIQDIKPKKGRPITQTKEVHKSSQQGTKGNETRATFIVNEELLDKVKAMAYWERKQIKEIINLALLDAVAKYEREKGSIEKTPKK